MLVKYWYAGWMNADLPIKGMLALSRQWGKDSLAECSNDDWGQVQIHRDSALVISGGRQSIIQSLADCGEKPLLTGGPPFMLATARKHHMFGKNETAIKLIANRRKAPDDGGDYVDLAKFVQSAVPGPAAYGMGIMLVGSVSVKPYELAQTLQRIFKV